MNQVLYALNAKGDLESLYPLTRVEIEQKRKACYFCPVCHELLHIRSGDRTVPHFAHVPKSRCSAFKGGESIEHERGKWKLFQWLKGQGYEVSIETYLPEIQQRPDLYMLINEKRIAIEYQCAAVPKKNILRRTTSYREAEIFPFWILGPKHFHSPITLNDFTRTFLYYFNDDYQMFYFHASKDLFTVVTHAQSAGGRRLAANISSSSLHKLSFHQLFTTGSPSSSNHRLLSEIERLWYRNRTVYEREVSSEERQYRQYLYLRGYHFSLIPSICYLPVRSQVQFEKKPYLWQARLFIDYFQDIPVGSYVQFPRLEVPPTPNGYSPDLSFQYLELLAQLNIVEKTGKNNYIKKKQVTFHKRLDDALKDDCETLQRLKNLQRIKI